MNSKGDLLVHPYDKSENIGEFDFTKQIIKNKNGLVEYEHKGVRKLAAYRYFEPCDWYIVTTANYDDLKSSSREILYITLITGGIMFLFRSHVGFIYGKYISKTY